MLVSQKKAKQLIREATGLSLQECARLVASMPKRADGCRMKVRLSTVDAAIAAELAPPAPTASILRPLAKKQVVAGRVVTV